MLAYCHRQYNIQSTKSRKWEGSEEVRACVCAFMHVCVCVCIFEHVCVSMHWVRVKVVIRKQWVHCDNLFNNSDVIIIAFSCLRVWLILFGTEMQF